VRSNAPLRLTDIVEAGARERWSVRRAQ
jgi:hypothetical protein